MIGSNAVVRQSLWRVSGSSEEPNYLLNLSIPGNASQPLKWKSVHWADASTETDHGDSAPVKAWNDSSVMAVHSQEKNFGTMWLLTYSRSMYLWTLQSKFAINRPVLYYWISFLHLKNISFKAWSQYWQWRYCEIIPQCYLSHCGLISVHSFRIHVIHYNELSEEGHTWTRSGNSYLSGSWTGKQPVLRLITRQEIPY